MKWKYKILRTRLDGQEENEMDAYGKKGWELFDWEYIPRNRMYWDYDEAIFVFRRKLVKKIKTRGF